MAGGVTYDGVKSATGGVIFKDMIFWVSRKVPMRNKILEHIQNNSGEVVPLEKDAQMLIADHARRDAPADSFSWKYITDSVEHGIAQLGDRYRIWGDSETKPLGGRRSAPKTLTRTPFSAADDAFLANWVLAHKTDRAGNVIYQEFAQLHPSHTWQSWRNRFLKTLMNLREEDLQKLAMSAPDVAVETSTTPRQPAPTKGTPKQAGKKAPRAAKSPQTTPGKQQSHTPQRTAPISPSIQVQTPQGNISGGSARRKKQQLEIATTPGTKSDEIGVETQANMRHQFYLDLLLFVEEFDADIDLDPVVRGAPVDLWDLSQAVDSQKVPLEEVDWMKVAEDLGFNWVLDQDVIGELRICHQHNLEGFFEAYDGLGDEQSPGVISEKNNVPSSPPVRLSNLKRSLDYQRSSSVENPSKRRRLSRTVEIPSTPEERLAVLSTQSPSVQKALQIQQAHGGSSKVTARLKLPPPLIGEEVDDITSETQSDIQIEPVPQLETRQSTFDDVTPSQQLHSEALDTSPIPLNLEQSRHDDDAQPQYHNPTALQTSTTKPKSTSRVTKRSLPTSFKPSSERLSVQDVEKRAQQPLRPNRVEPAEEGFSQNIRDCVEYYEALGHSRPIVIESLHRTTLTPGWPATLLFDMLKSKQGIPQNMEGVWTDRDDKSLRYAGYVESRKSTANTRERNKAKKELDRIVHKHGEAGVELRRRYLAATAKKA
ncbi:hypothetical protein QQS21_004273 [Conoideocrella luteorostrata]|uniref:DNA-binding protein RAP1 n=1 Tax=Conoideocrella luteorostrata TaxID=1105319 RepID=A0AAJ0FUT1_9HYPO|nr:hypothetical protein QQS21_004273 [Conoideocrella luteorostrata]